MKIEILINHRAYVSDYRSEILCFIKMLRTQFSPNFHKSVVITPEARNLFCEKALYILTTRAISVNIYNQVIFTLGINIKQNNIIQSKHFTFK